MFYYSLSFIASFGWYVHDRLILIILFESNSKYICNKLTKAYETYDSQVSTHHLLPPILFL